MATLIYGDVSWERMMNAVEKVRQRLLRAATALNKALDETWATRFPHPLSSRLLDLVADPLG